MKKKSFLSGISAKLALAAVALTTMVFTSCEKEEFIVEPIEVAPASATIFATVYDQTTGENLGSTTQTIAAGQDGTIAEQTITVTCPFSSAEYLLVAPIEVKVPKVAKGQMILIPVTFYAQKITSAAKDITVSKDEETVKPGNDKTNSVSKEYTGTGLPMDVEYEALVGTKVINKAEIFAYIETLVNASRAMSNSEVISVLKALVNTYDNQAVQTIKDKVTMTKGVTFVLKPVTATRNYTMSINATVDGTNFTIPNIQVNEAMTTAANPTVLDHGHGHGNSSNAGGGAAGK